MSSSTVPPLTCCVAEAMTEPTSTFRSMITPSRAARTSVSSNAIRASSSVRSARTSCALALATCRPVFS
jgi:hypothetical protein